MQKEKKMSQEKTKKIQKCPLCAKHCSVNNLVCARGYQLFDDSDDLFRLMRRCGHDELIAQKGEYYQLYTGAFELE